MLAPLTGSDNETYLNVVKAVINTQEDGSFGSLESMQGPPRDNDPFASPAPSLRHSASLIALRQEIWSVLLYRRPFRLPLCPDNDYGNLGQADDFVWTNRILIWCADVLRFCFGEDSGISSLRDVDINRNQRWESLVAFEQSWKMLQPSCFEPIYYQEQEHAKGRYFPDIWLTNDCQVLGLQHIELARILLAVYNPKLQRLGLGTSALNHALESQLRQSTLKICGMALSNHKRQPTLVTAAVGVSMCGEYFHDAGEQTAIMDFLIDLETEHAWPTQTIVQALRDAWELRSASRVPRSAVMSTPI